MPLHVCQKHCCFLPGLESETCRSSLRAGLIVKLYSIHQYLAHSLCALGAKALLRPRIKYYVKSGDKKRLMDGNEEARTQVTVCCLILRCLLLMASLLICCSCRVNLLICCSLWGGSLQSVIVTIAESAEQCDPMCTTVSWRLTKNRYLVKEALVITDRFH